MNARDNDFIYHNQGNSFILTKPTKNVIHYIMIVDFEYTPHLKQEHKNILPLPSK